MSNREYPLYTIKNNCQDCYKCVRRCPVKAIKIEDGSAMIVPDLCIACGTCYRVCPAKAKQARNDLTRAKHLVQSGKRSAAGFRRKPFVHLHRLSGRRRIHQ